MNTTTSTAAGGLTRVERPTFRDFVRSWGDRLASRPVQTEFRSVMQYLDPESGDLMAQAIYVAGLNPEYRIRQEAR